MQYVSGTKTLKINRVNNTGHFFHCLHKNKHWGIFPKTALCVPQKNRGLLSWSRRRWRVWDAVTWLQETSPAQIKPRGEQDTQKTRRREKWDANVSVTGVCVILWGSRRDQDLINTEKYSYSAPETLMLSQTLCDEERRCSRVTEVTQILSEVK